MKLLLDFLPLALFFLTYKVAGGHADATAQLLTHWLGNWVSGGSVGPKEAPILLATVVVIAATALQVAWLKFTRQKVHLMLWISLALIVVLGGLTIWLHNETFIKWKATGVFWLMAGTFWVAQTFFHRNLYRSMLSTLDDEIKFDLPEQVWQRVNMAWIGFFTVMGLLNLLFVYAFSTDAWATFHSFGSTALMLVFVLVQLVYLSRHLKHEPAPAAAPDREPAP
jgi:intracellular septation protein